MEARNLSHIKFKVTVRRVLNRKKNDIRRKKDELEIKITMYEMKDTLEEIKVSWMNQRIKSSI